MLDSRQITMENLTSEVIQDKTLNNQDHLFKLIIIGDTGVGKSCLMKRVMDNDFKTEHQVTIGVEFGSFVVKIDGKIVKIQIWDTAGQESFRSVTRIFYRGAHCVFLTYDISRNDTFTNLIQWLSEIKEHANTDVKIYLIGNKSELVQEREVAYERALEFAKAHGIHKVFETSAKTGQNVEEVFVSIGKELYLQVKQQELEEQKLKKQIELNEQREHEQDTEEGNSKKQKKLKLTQPDLRSKNKKTKKKGCC